VRETRRQQEAEEDDPHNCAFETKSSSKFFLHKTIAKSFCYPKHYIIIIINNSQHPTKPPKKHARTHAHSLNSFSSQISLLLRLFSQKKNKTRFLLTYKTDQRATRRDGFVQRAHKQTHTPKRKQTQPQTKSLTPYSNSNPKEFTRAEHTTSKQSREQLLHQRPKPKHLQRLLTKHTHTPQNNNNNNNNNQRRRSSRRGKRKLKNCREIFFQQNKTKSGSKKK